MRRRSVVLPEPLSPRMVRNSPSSTCREMARSTGSLPKLLATWRMESRIAAAARASVAGEVMTPGAAPRFRRLSRGRPARESGPQDAGATLLRGFPLVPDFVVLGAAGNILPEINALL